MSEDVHQDILKELKKSRRSNQMILVAASLIVLISLILRPKPSNPENSWTGVDSAMRRLDFPRALSLAKDNVERQPDYYYGHSYLGTIYLAMDDVTNSEAQYLRAYELFPSEDNEKNLAAVRKRLAAGKDSKISK
jgi:hypothetical protein